ncbi:MAG: type II toxin-antitoxin system PemK/MazF family toxin [Methanosarcinales archaeon]
MSNINRGEIYLARSFDFPHQKTSEIKNRPVLILQCAEDNKNDFYPLVIVAPITTKKTDYIYQQDVFLKTLRNNLILDLN